MLMACKLAPPRKGMSDTPYRVTGSYARERREGQNTYRLIFKLYGSFLNGAMNSRYALAASRGVVFDPPSDDEMSGSLNERTWLAFGRLLMVATSPWALEAPWIMGTNST